MAVAPILGTALFFVCYGKRNRGAFPNENRKSLELERECS